MDDLFEDSPDDPLDLDGDGDHIVDMGMIFDEEDQQNRPDQGTPPGGCLGMLLIMAVPGLFFLLRPVLS